MATEFEEYNLEEEEDPIPAPPRKEGRRLTMWRILPLILTMPATGWERVKTQGPRPEIAVIRFLLPLCLLAAGAEFFAVIYQRNEWTLTNILVTAVISFCSFFLGYYIALLLSTIFLPKDIKDLPKSDYGRLLTMTGVGTLAIFQVLYRALPMLDFIIEFLPLWTVFIIFRGMRQSPIQSEKATISISVMCLAVIAAPSLVEMVLALFA